MQGRVRDHDNQEEGVVLRHDGQGAKGERRHVVVPVVVHDPRLYDIVG